MSTEGTEEITTAEIIDSRDVIARITFLQECADEGNGLELDSSEQEELAALLALQDEAEPYAADWRYGEALIRDDHFEDYAQELAEEIGAVDPNAGWPNCYIDWPVAADALKGDYTSVTFRGETYWTR